MDDLVVTAEKAAEAFGVPVATIEASVRMRGPNDLFGVFRDGRCYVCVWELEGNRAAMHRGKLPSVADVHTPVSAAPGPGVGR